MRLKLTLIGGLILLNCSSVQAAILAHINNAPKVLSRSPYQGSTIVNINQADRNGVSINGYYSFDVDSNGVILANNTYATRSSKGQYVEANDQLRYGSARVIINEVFSNYASNINGMIEVTGPRADVLIINPSGINCNGCGFINTNNATLSTARYQLGYYGDISFNVENDNPIRIGGGGLSDHSSNNLNLITKTLKVDGRISARNNLNVITGRNKISGNLRYIHSMGNGHGSDLIISSVAGMYAQNISIVSTQSHGNGIFNNGQIVATNNLNINAHGELTNGSSYNHYANIASNYGSVAINLGNYGSLNNHGKIEASKDINIFTHIGSVTNNIGGSIIKKGSWHGNININALKINTLHNSSIRSNNQINLTSNLLFNGGRIAATGDLNIISRSGSITNLGSLDGRIIKFLRFNDFRNSGSINASDAIVVRGNTFSNAYGSNVFARNNFDIMVNHRFLNHGGVKVGIRGVTSRSWFSRLSFKNFFLDANWSKRRFDHAGNTLSSAYVPPKHPPHGGGKGKGRGRGRPAPPPRW